MLDPNSRGSAGWWFAQGLDCYTFGEGPHGLDAEGSPALIERRSGVHNSDGAHNSGGGKAGVPQINYWIGQNFPGNHKLSAYNL